MVSPRLPWWSVTSAPARHWCVLAGMVPMLATGAGDKDKPAVPMRDVTIRGEALPDSAGGRVHLVVRAVIGTPIGRIPINTYMRLRYDCASGFTGQASYAPVVRLLAKIKGVDLIRSFDGRVEQDATGECPRLEVRELLGRATVEEAQLSGLLTLDGVALAFRGPAWMAGDTSYHSVVSAKRGGRDIVLTVNMYER